MVCGGYLTCLVVNILLHIYAVHAWPESAKAPNDDDIDAEDGAHPKPSRANGHARSPSEARHIHDAEAFELQGLISDEEEEARAGHQGRHQKNEDGEPQTQH